MSFETFKGRVADNGPGRFYVGDCCTDCDLCRETAPSNSSEGQHQLCRAWGLDEGFQAHFPGAVLGIHPAGGNLLADGRSAELRTVLGGMEMILVYSTEQFVDPWWNSGVEPTSLGRSRQSITTH